MNTSMPGTLSDDITLLLHLERGSGKTLQRQLIEQLRQAILQGQLAPGSRLPSTRALASILGISRNIALNAYDELYTQGYLERHRGSGTYVSPELAVPQRPDKPTSTDMPTWLPDVHLPEPDAPSFPQGTIVFQPGIPDISLLSWGTWRAIWKEVLQQLPPTSYSVPAGESELRASLAGLLLRLRAIQCDAEDIVITSGAAQALDLVGRAVLTRGSRVGFEEPGYAMARQALQAQGARIVPLAVDQGGMRVEELPRGRGTLSLVYVTPSHQYPLAARLSLPRRMALLEWAKENESLVIEDDYESAFRFDAAPLPALVSLDAQQRVVYIGTFSNIVTPALRLGYLIAPPALRRRVEQLQLLTNFHPSWLIQRAFHIMITEGHLERHIRRARRIYAEKRALLASLLSPVAHLAQLHGVEAGLHAYLALDERLKAQEIARETAQRLVIVKTLDEYYLGKPDRNGLVLGYGGLSSQEIERGMKILAEVITHLSTLE